MLKVSDISKKNKDDYILRNINFEQQQGEKLAIAGATGSGKSTLLKLIGGLDQADEGQIFFKGERVKGIYEKLMPGHNKIAYLSQQYELLNNYYVDDLLSYPNKLEEKQADELYALCRINHLLKRRTHELSGGEKQRIALARLLVTLPELLLLDEPFSNLDLHHKQILKEVIHDIGNELQTSFILISHDAQDTLSWADTIMIMKDGAIEQKASPAEIYTKPKNEYCAGLFGPYNLIPGNDNRLFIRPEKIKIIEETSSSSIKVTISNIQYFGSHYLLQVQSMYGDLLINTNQAYHVNDVVDIIMPVDNKHYL